MNTRTIQKLRHKFILISTVSYFLVMVFIGGCINFSNYFMTERQIGRILDYILDHNGIIPSTRHMADETAESSFEEMMSEAENTRSRSTAESGSTVESGSTEGRGTASEASKEELQTIVEGENSFLEDFSPEFYYSARFITGVFDESGSLSDLRMVHVNEVTNEQVSILLKAVYKINLRYGRLGNYYYKQRTLPNGETIIVMLNCASQIRTNNRILSISILICSAGLLITLMVVWICSSRVVQPEIENIRRQKQFITNASHELKTPLAVIRANTEIDEMINGESEWTQSTMRQVDRLDGLVQNLVMIARADEREDRSVMTEIDVSTNVEESVKPYRSLAQQDKKELILDIAPEVRMVADESKIRQLTTLLVDNAFKYCDEGGVIRVILTTLKKGRTIRLVVANTFANGANVDYSRFFERFYREDEAHCVDKGGYGIGLSIAESICRQYGGSIDVSWKNGEIAFTCLLT